MLEKKATYPDVKYYDNISEAMRLNEVQRGRLVDREVLSKDFDIRKRRENEFAVRNHLKSFLEFIPDANLILDKLPRDQLKNSEKLGKYLNDDSINALFQLILKLLDLLDYMPIQGPPRRQYVTKIVSEKPGDVISRRAKDLDLVRNISLQNFVAQLAEFYQIDFGLLVKYKIANSVINNEKIKAELKDPSTVKALKDSGITPDQFISFRISKESRYVESVSK
jgi:hypothetical protein